MNTAVVADFGYRPRHAEAVRDAEHNLRETERAGFLVRERIDSAERRIEGRMAAHDEHLGEVDRRIEDRLAALAGEVALEGERTRAQVKISQLETELRIRDQDTLVRDREDRLRDRDERSRCGYPYPFPYMGRERCEPLGQRVDIRIDDRQFDANDDRISHTSRTNRVYAVDGEL